MEVLSFLESGELWNEVRIGVGGIASISYVLYEKGNENLFEKYFKKIQSRFIGIQGRIR